MHADEAALDGATVVSRRSAIPYWTIAIGALALAHFAFLMAFFAPAISTPDANGYFAQATRIVETGRTGFLPSSPLEYIGMHWLRADSGWYYCRYSPGLPIILAGAMAIAGSTGALLVNPIMASLSLVALFLVVARWAGPGWGLLAAVLIAVNPIANAHALGADSHTSVAFFLVWGLYGLERWRTGRALGWALLSGLCFGMVPAIRYPEVLMSAAAGVFAIHAVLTARKRDWRSLVAFAAAAGAPLVALAVRNHYAFGAFWRTGYSLTNEQTGFGLDYFVQHSVQYLENIPGAGMGIAFGLGVAGMAFLCARRGTRALGWLLVGLVVPTTLLYMAYYWAPRGRGQATMRFLVPTFYVYAAAAAWFLSLLSHGGMRRPAWAAALAVALVGACWGLPLSISASSRLEKQNAVLARVTEALRRHAPKGSVVIAGNQILQHLDFEGGWKLADARVVQGGGAMGRMGAMGPMGASRRARGQNSDRPSPMQRSKMESRAARYANLRGTALTGQIVSDLRQWAGSDTRIFWIGDADTIHGFEDNLPWDEGMRTLETLNLDSADVGGRMGGGMGGPPDGGGLPGGMMGGGPDGAGAPAGPGGQVAQGGFAARQNVRNVRNAQGAAGQRRQALAARRGGPGGRLVSNGEPLLIVEWIRADGSQKKKSTSSGRSRNLQP